MRAARRPRLVTGSRKLVRRTTRTPEPRLRPIKLPTRMEATEARSTPRTATQRTPSIKRRRQAPWDRYKLPQVAKVLPHRAHTAIAALWDKLQMATSMRRRTGMSTRTPGAVGTKPRELPNPPQATQAHRATTNRPPATRGPTLLLLEVMGGRKRAAGHRPSEEAAVAVGGNPGRRVLVVRQAEAAAAAGAVVVKPRVRRKRSQLQLAALV